MPTSARTVLHLVLLPVCVLAVLLSTPHLSAQRRGIPKSEAMPFAPRQTVCYRTPARLVVDGKLDEDAWRATTPSEPFVDIEGSQRPRPRYQSAVKMLWDDEFFYVGAEIEEPDIWATIRARDSVIFQDNDFEVFIDPDGDTHAYYELEVNAFATAWDLLLLQPYRDGGPAVHGWDIAGLEVGVDVRGTINRPGDKDSAWTVEIAMPWTILREAAPGRTLPQPGDQWRVNFSRVEWDIDVNQGAYAKRLDTSTGKPLPEHNWVWSPQGAINMHMPELWGFVQFSNAAAGSQSTAFIENRNERVKWALRRLYYRQQQYRTDHGRYASDLAALAAATIRVDGLDFRPSMQMTDSQYEIVANGFDGAVVHLRQDGRVWVTR
jgi:hypothetical protein